MELTRSLCKGRPLARFQLPKTAVIILCYASQCGLFLFLHFTSDMQTASMSMMVSAFGVAYVVGRPTPALLAAFPSMLLNSALLAMVTTQPWAYMLSISYLSGLVGVFALAGITGRIREISINLKQEIDEHKKTQRELELSTADLADRLRELNGLYGIANLVEVGRNLDDILQTAVELIPKALRNADKTMARISTQDKSYLSHDGQPGQSLFVTQTQLAQDDSMRLEIFSAHGNRAWEITKEEKQLIRVMIRRLADTIDGFFSQEDAEQARKQLSQAHKMEAIGTLAGGIAHDFNNILYVIQGHARLAGNEKENDHIREVIKACNRASELVRQILTFSRKAEPRVLQMQLTKLIEEAATMLREILPSTIQIKLSVDETCPNIMGDPIQIHQLLLNLATNAKDAMQEHGGGFQLTLDQVIYENASYVRLQVQDSGCGMPSTVQERIFEPFFTTKELHAGTGLGLSTVHGIVESHKGKILVESHLGVGTRFEILFPATSLNKQVANRNEKSISMTGSGNILFVDDEIAITTMSQKILSRLGYSVEAYNDSSEALSAFLNDPNKYDLVITDQTMPHPTGTELSEKILATRPNMPIVLCSGQIDLEIEQLVESIGVSKYLTKPISPDELVVTIQSLIDKTPN